MSTVSRIEWTDRTWNPTLGCSKVSAGCTHCYAMRQAHRFSRVEGHPFEGLTTARGEWSGEIKLMWSRVTEPYSWREPARVFVDSMSDLFHPDVPVQFIASVWRVMARTPQHTYQILTKRPARMREILNDPAFLKTVRVWQDAGHSIGEEPEFPTWPLPNVWLGTSVEGQDAANARVPELARTPAAVRFLSCEPLLGPVSLLETDAGDVLSACDACGETGAEREPHPDDEGAACYQCCDLGRIHWVIAGGESGPGARPVDPAWVRRLRDDCHAADVAFFFKQWGGTRKKLAGRELDGRTWDEFPVTPAPQEVPA